MRNIITRRFFFSMLLALPFSAQAQQAAKIPRIGYVTGSSPPTATTPDLNADAFKEGLRELGYIEGKNIQVEYRYAEGKPDRYPGLLAELVQLKVDVLVTIPAPATLAAKQATKTIPIVMVSNDDPVAVGLVDSLARPGGNLTGVTRFTRELSGKRLELFKELAPKTSRVGVLFQAGNPSAAGGLKEYEPAAQALKLQLRQIEVQGPPHLNLEGSFEAAKKARINALIVMRNALLVVHRKQIADLAVRHGLPLMAEGTDFVESGALVSYASDDVANFKRAALYVDKILKGRRPEDLPVEQPMKFEFVVNLKTAKQINVTIPQWTLMKADRVIR